MENGNYTYTVTAGALFLSQPARLRGDRCKLYEGDEL